MSEAGRKMSLSQATMLVAGNMIGTGIFLLPVNLAHVGGIAIFGWLIATTGVAALGLTFAKLGELKPLQGGPYAYARDFLGSLGGWMLLVGQSAKAAGTVVHAMAALLISVPLYPFFIRSMALAGASTCR